MKSLTDQFIEKSQGILNIYPEVSDNTDKYQMFDSGATEIEVAEYLWGLVKILKPETILETGTFTGVSSLYIAQALKENNYGHLITIEYERFHKDRAEQLWQNCDVSQFVTCELKSSLDFQPDKKYQLIFLDSEPQIRFAELEKFSPFLEEGGYIGIHDLPRTLCQGNINPDHPDIKSYPFGDIPPLMKELLQTGKLIKIHFPSPRGLTFFYKSRDDDYKP